MERPPPSPPLARARRVLGYLALAGIVLGPVLRDPRVRLPGFANIDLWDTVMLRGVVLDLLRHPTGAPQSDALFYPVGYPVLQLLPNLLDHLTGALFALVLPFPLSDTLWWWAVLALNGLCGHRLGRRLGGSEGAGWLVGVALLFSEALAREVNLHHAPQAMIFWAPLYLEQVLALREDRRAATAARAGALLALAGWSYWYQALFLGLGSLPLLLGLGLLPLLALGGTALGLALPLALPFLWTWGQIPLTAGAEAPPALDLPAAYAALPPKEAFVAWHGNDLAFPLRATPLDTSNRLSLVLLAAAALGARRMDRARAAGLLAMALLGAVMVLGPVLRWGEDLVTVGGEPVTLPFAWLGRLHPVIARMTWPERWGLLLPLALGALAARAPRPGLLAALVAVEALLLSGNLPVQATDLRHRTCTAALAPRGGDRGAVLELPLKRPGLQAPRAGVHRRFHRRPMVNAILLPPGAQPPAGWLDWLAERPMIRAIQALEEGRWPDDPGAEAVADLQAQGVAALVLDADPGAVLTDGGLTRHRMGLGRLLGPPIDLGCAFVWWLDPTRPPPTPVADGDAWRAEARAWKDAHPTPVLDTLIRPGTERGSGAR